MPRKTDGDKIDDLEKLVATLIERVDNMRKDLGVNGQSVLDVVRQFSDFRIEFTAIKKDCESLLSWKAEQKSDRAEKSRRYFSLLPNIVGALIGSALTIIGTIIYNALKNP